MASNAITTAGILISRGDGEETESFEVIAEVLDFDGPGASSSKIDVTSLDSTAREYRLGLKDNGSFSFNCILVPLNTVQQGLQSDQDARVLRNFKITFPKQNATSATALTYEFAAYVSEFRTSGGVDEVVKASVTLDISGNVTKTHEAAA